MLDFLFGSSAPYPGSRSCCVCPASPTCAAPACPAPPPAPQVEGAGGFSKLVAKVRVGGPTVLYHGALAASAATFVGHYPWCASLFLCLFAVFFGGSGLGGDGSGILSPDGESYRGLLLAGAAPELSMELAPARPRCPRRHACPLNTCPTFNTLIIAPQPPRRFFVYNSLNDYLPQVGRRAACLAVPALHRLPCVQSPRGARPRQAGIARRVSHVFNEKSVLRPTAVHRAAQAPDALRGDRLLRLGGVGCALPASLCSALRWALLVLGVGRRGAPRLAGGIKRTCPSLPHAPSLVIPPCVCPSPHTPADTCPNSIPTL